MKNLLWSSFRFSFKFRFFILEFFLYNNDNNNKEKEEKEQGINFLYEMIGTTRGTTLSEFYYHISSEKTEKTWTKTGFRYCQDTFLLFVRFY